MQQQKWDYILVGGGVSSLVLLLMIIRQKELQHKSILIIDPDWQAIQHRTMAYWTDHRTPFDHLALATWNKIKVASTSRFFTKTLRKYHYLVVEGAQLYDFVRAETQQHTVTWLTGMVSDVTSTNKEATVSVNNTQYTAEWVFDSRFNPSKQAVSQGMKQHFYGAFLTTPRPAFDSDVPTLMDFRVPQFAPWTFAYVLPFSERSALVEIVSSQPLRNTKVLEQYLREGLRLSSWTITKTESGTSLLTPYRFTRQPSPRVMTIGRSGGMIKPSSGFAFSRILEDSQRIVNNLAAHRSPTQLPGSPWFYRWTDQLMILMIAEQPALVPDLFTMMFRRNPADRVFDFLNERIHWHDAAQFIYSLPQLLFIKHALIHSWPFSYKRVQ